MTASETLLFALRAVLAERLRSSLSMLGIAIGVAAVVLLTSIGEGTRRYVLDQFTQFGTNLVTVSPGKSETVGIPGVLGGTTQKLTVDDAREIARLVGIERVMPSGHGQARVEAGGRGRSVGVYGVTSDLLEIWKTRVQKGSFLSPGDPSRGAQVVVLGPVLERELFGDRESLGQPVRIGNARFRVIGVLAPKGKFLGIDLDDAAYVPLAAHMQVFDRDEVSEINVLVEDAAGIDAAVGRIRELLVSRHRDREDFTITTQGAMLDVFGGVMRAVTLAVAGIAGISLLVGALGILTVLWISVGERTGEIGLLRAIGASSEAVLWIFLAEAAALAAAGALVGLAGALASIALLRALVPGLPVVPATGWIGVAFATSVAAGLLSGVMPARRAAELDPIEALRAE